jgi:hypothetical protein
LADATGKSLPTADRRIDHIAGKLPNTRRVRDGKTTWFVHDERRRMPSRPATVGACVAASLGLLTGMTKRGIPVKFTGEERA